LHQQPAKLAKSNHILWLDPKNLTISKIFSTITKYYVFFALLFMQLRDSFGAETDCTGRVMPALHEGVFGNRGDQEGGIGNAEC
jgi:hypothetical protein